MHNFYPLLKLGVKRRCKDFFLLFYSAVFPVVIIALMGYLSSKSYGSAFTSYEYYAITMMPFCLFMGITSVAYASADEKRMKTACRFVSAPISKTSLVFSKFYSCVAAFNLCNLFVLIVASIFFHLPRNGSFVPIAALLFCESVAITGLGLFFGLAMKNFAAIQNFLNLPIMIFGFLSGAFFPVHSLNPFLSVLINLSPLTWINRAMLYCIYESERTVLYLVGAVLLAVGTCFVLLTIKFFKKEAFVS